MPPVEYRVPILDGSNKVKTADLGGAGADAKTFLRGDQTWAVPTGYGIYLVPEGDVENVAEGKMMLEYYLTETSGTINIDGLLEVVA